MTCSSGSDDNVEGDGVLIYPGVAGPLSSIRLENIADGLEDYELFRRIKNVTRRDALISRLVVSGDIWVTQCDRRLFSYGSQLNTQPQSLCRCLYLLGVFSDRLLAISDERSRTAGVDAAGGGGRGAGGGRRLRQILMGNS